MVVLFALRCENENLCCVIVGMSVHCKSIGLTETRDTMSLVWYGVVIARVS